MSQTFAPSATYGSSAIKNRIRIGGELGSNQYFYITNAKTGTIEINRYEKSKDGTVTTAKIGSVPQGGKFTPSAHATSAETSHYNSPKEIGKVRQQALQIARREWDGKTQPPPHQAIYGTDSGNIGYTPPGASTAINSIKGVQNTGYSSDINTSSSTTSSSISNSLRDIASSGMGSLIGGALGSGRRQRRGGRGGGGTVFVYPTTLRRSGNAQDYLKIQRMVWAGRQRTGVSWGARGGENGRQLKESVILPIPGGISDTNAVSWGSDTMDPAQTAMANLALTGINEGAGAMVDEAANIVNQAGENREQIGEALSAGIAGMASGTGAQLLTRTTGQILNPNMELLFKNPSLRPFTFTWKLAARSKAEANAIIRIINLFKKRMAPSVEGGGLFLKSPDTWKLTYMHKGREHQYLNKFKECAMQSLTTQYTPDGNYATFETGHMVAYSITMSLQELEPVFSGDYDGIDGLGY